MSLEVVDFMDTLRELIRIEIQPSTNSLPFTLGK